MLDWTLTDNSEQLLKKVVAHCTSLLPIILYRDGEQKRSELSAT